LSSIEEQDTKDRNGTIQLKVAGLLFLAKVETADGRWSHNDYDLEVLNSWVVGISKAWRGLSRTMGMSVKHETVDMTKLRDTPQSPQPEEKISTIPSWSTRKAVIQSPS
jgi:hypothetical protein